MNGSYTDPILGGPPCFNRRLGKLNKQSRYNYVTLSESEGEIEVELREEMTYCGRGGRLSRKSLENWVNDGLHEAFFLPNITYNTLGNVTSIDYPRCTHSPCAPAASSPRTVTSSYINGFLTAIGIPSNAGYYATSIAYHPNLMVHQVVHNNNPSDASKRLTDTYANDPNAMRRPASITVTTPTSSTRWSSGTYTYDGAGNIKGIGTSSFTYDLVSRLKTADVKTASENLIFADGFETADMSCWDTGTCPESDLMRSQTYTFDAFGNIKAIGGDSARNTPTTSSTNRLSSANYDAAGNLTGWTAPNTTTHSYDPFNLMWKHHTDSGQWIYLYTADDERVWSYKTDNTSLWTLRGPGAEVLREYTTDGGWAVASDYIYRNSSLLATETPQGIRHFHLDHLGTPRLISDSQGQQTAYHVYFPFGEEATDFNQDTIRTKFTGHERDLGSLEGAGDDLDYMHARHCSPVTGRFLSVDPVNSARPLNPQSWNRYVYSLDNPLIVIDPDGLEPYIVSRPLGFTSKGSHLFIVTHAKHPGDPKAKIKSFGQKENFNMGRVDNSTQGFSEDTHQADQDAWDSLAKNTSGDVDYLRLPSDDTTVESYADSVMEDQDYAATGKGGVNSNSAAIAVAEESTQRQIDPPGTRPAPGAGKSDQVRFDKNKNKKPEKRRFQRRPPP